MKFSTRQAQDQLQNTLTPAYQQLNHYSRGIPDILAHAIRSFNRAFGSEGAAAMAFFTIFSTIPLLLLLVSIGGFLLAGFDATDQIFEFIYQIIPLPLELIEENLRQVLEVRSIGGIIALVGLAWAASSSFITLSRNINRAWPGASRLNIVQGRLIALGIVGALVALVIIWSFASSTIRFLFANLDEKILGDISLKDTFLWTLSSGALPWGILFIALFTLYRWVPNTRVRWSEAFWGALVATLSIHIATRVFTWYLRSGLINFEIIYGSLGTSLAFLTWVYISSTLAVFGAHLSAAIATLKRVNEIPADPDTLSGEIFE